MTEPPDPRSLFGEGPYGALLSVLGESQMRGFLGPGPVMEHVDRALDALGAIPPGVRTAMDLGSGGGVPGLPLALALGEVAWVLLDGSVTRCRFLTEAIGELAIDDRVAVCPERAETAGRGDLRGTFDLVVARSFGPPAATAECAAPFLRVGGALVVAEPPGGRVDRWPADGLRLLGLARVDSLAGRTSFQVLRTLEPCPNRYPRRTGVPTKRPLF